MKGIPKSLQPKSQRSRQNKGIFLRQRKPFSALVQLIKFDTPKQSSTLYSDSHAGNARVQISPLYNKGVSCFHFHGHIFESFGNLEFAKMAAKTIGYLVCLLIMIMDITAGILGIQAEIAQNKVKNLRVWIFECRDPSYEAFKLGLAATVLLSLAHVIANMLSGCICIWSKEELDRSTNNKQLAVASLVLSWVILAIAFALLIGGTLSNSRSRKNCGIAHHRLLSIGGILCFIHGLFAVAYYISATAAVQEDKMLNQPAAVAHP